MARVLDDAELAVVGALAAARVPVAAAEVVRMVAGAGLGEAAARAALERAVAGELAALRGDDVELAPAGAVAFLDTHAAIEAALDPSPSAPHHEECPSIPWLTTVQTEWIDAVSINYAVEPAALARLLPAPLEPELHEGSAWVQVLVSSLRDMRPQGLASLFGVCFYQVSYRAAVRYRDAAGAWRRGGYFVRSETNDAIMRTVGNKLVEFKFHDFGPAEMVMLRDGDRLTIGIEPERPGGRVFGRFHTAPSDAPPAGSVWRSLAHLHEPLVECYDALGVDREAGFLYLLTIDRDPWNAHFVTPESLYCEYVDTGALGGAARLDSVLHLDRCVYRWRPLRRERL